MFCEKISREVFPAIRAVATKKLITEHNLTQKDVAKLMGISQPAVSLYYRNFRGKSENIENNPNLVVLIDNLVEKMCNRKSKSEIQECYCEICKFIRENNFLE